MNRRQLLLLGAALGTAASAGAFSFRKPAKPAYEIRWLRRWNGHHKNTIDTILMVFEGVNNPIYVDSVSNHFNTYESSDQAVDDLLREFRLFVDANPRYEEAYTEALNSSFGFTMQ